MTVGGCLRPEGAGTGIATDECGSDRASRRRPSDGSCSEYSVGREPGLLTTRWVGSSKADAGDLVGDCTRMVIGSECKRSTSVGERE